HKTAQVSPLPLPTSCVMAEVIVSGTRPGTAASGDGLPEVRLELRHGSNPPMTFFVGDTAFLIGSAPGCDLRLPGAEVPPVLCLLARRAGSVALRKLASAAPLHVNGKPVSAAPLTDGDRIAIGPFELTAHVQVSELRAPRFQPVPDDSELDPAREELRQQVLYFQE